MVQKRPQDKPARRPRGRPRAYQPEAALARAMDTFWQGGFSGTSLDQLSAAMEMNRPSLYGAFGDKQALYLKTLDAYRDASAQGLRKLLAPDIPLRDGLLGVYSAALARYLGGEQGPRGCYLIGTAAVEAVTDPVIRDRFAANLRELDAAFEGRFKLARAQGEIAADADVQALAKLASAVLHTLAIRSRAGDSRASLKVTAEAGVALICGAPPGTGGKRRRAT